MASVLEEEQSQVVKSQRVKVKVKSAVWKTRIEMYRLTSKGLHVKRLPFWGKEEGGYLDFWRKNTLRRHEMLVPRTSGKTMVDMFEEQQEDKSKERKVNSQEAMGRIM